MIRRNTWILLLIFAVLLAVTFALSKDTSRKDAQPEATPAPALFSFDPLSQIAGVRLQDAEGRQVQVRLLEAQTWEVDGEPPRAADALAVGQALNQLASLRVLSRVGADTPLQALGLNPPYMRIEFALTGGGSVSLEVGAATPVGTGYYVRLDGGSPVVVAQYPLDALMAWLDTPPYAPTPSPEPSAAP